MPGSERVDPVRRRCRRRTSGKVINATRWRVSSGDVHELLSVTKFLRTRQCGAGSRVARSSADVTATRTQLPLPLPSSPIEALSTQGAAEIESSRHVIPGDVRHLIRIVGWYQSGWCVPGSRNRRYEERFLRLSNTTG